MSSSPMVNGPEFVANAIASGRVAATFARPADYVSFQIKGPVVRRPTRQEDIEFSDQYIAKMTATLMTLGLAPAAIAQWLSNRDAVVLQIAVDELFEQTPGSRAGQALTVSS